MTLNQIEEIASYIPKEAQKYIIEDFINLLNLHMPFKVAGTYDSINGKFSKVFGNVAIVDCNTFHNQLFSALEQAFTIMQYIDYPEYEQLYPKFE